MCECACVLVDSVTDCICYANGSVCKHFFRTLCLVVAVYTSSCAGIVHIHIARERHSSTHCILLDLSRVCMSVFMCACRQLLHIQAMCINSSDKTTEH